MANYVSPRDYAVLEQRLGKEKAADLAKKSGWSVVLPESNFTPVSDMGGGNTVDEADDTDLETENTDIADTNAYPATGGGLGAANAYGAYQAAQKRVDAQIKANIALLTDAQSRLRDRRTGPSNAEKWFSIAAALGKPTRTGSFGESVGNLGEVLAEQAAMKRKAQEERDALLEQYGLKIGGEQLRMLQSGATQAGQIYRAELAAGKKAKGALPRATVGPDFIPRTRYGTEVKQPPTAAVYVLQDYLKNPNTSDEDKKIARRNFDSKFGYGAAELFGGEE